MPRQARFSRVRLVFDLRHESGLSWDLMGAQACPLTLNPTRFILAFMNDHGLRQEIRKGRPITLVLGAGVSLSRGLPLWSDLMRKPGRLSGAMTRMRMI